MSLLREVKPRNARTARIVKAREPQLIESRKRVLLLHGTKCPQPVSAVLKTFNNLAKPHSVMLNKKNDNIRPFEDPASLEFLAMKNDCGIVVFGTHSKKRPNNITLLRMFDGKVLDKVELLMITEPDLQQDQKLQIGVEMKPMVLFAGSQWDDSSSSAQALLYQTLKSMLLDLFQGEEISAVDVAGLQYLLMIGTGESSNSSHVDDSASKPVLHLRWYRVKTLRSNSPKIPRVELESAGPSFDFRVGRFQEADDSVMREAMKHGRRPNEARPKKNVEMDLVGDKIGRVHLGRQDLSELQTRKMKGLKRTHKDLEDEVDNPTGEAEDVFSDNDDIEAGGMDLDDEDSVEGGSSLGGSGDEISIGDEDEEMGEVDDSNEFAKRQKLA